jgi:hypothetical protein
MANPPFESDESGVAKIYHRIPFGKGNYFFSIPSYRTSERFTNAATQANVPVSARL